MQKNQFFELLNHDIGWLIYRESVVVAVKIPIIIIDDGI